MRMNVIIIWLGNQINPRNFQPEPYLLASETILFVFFRPQVQEHTSHVKTVTVFFKTQTRHSVNYQPTIWFPETQPEKLISLIHYMSRMTPSRVSTWFWCSECIGEYYLQKIILSEVLLFPKGKLLFQPHAWPCNIPVNLEEQ